MAQNNTPPVKQELKNNSYYLVSIRDDYQMGKYNLRTKDIKFAGANLKMTDAVIADADIEWVEINPESIFNGLK
jgi:hypothetical protein